MIKKFAPVLVAGAASALLLGGSASAATHHHKPKQHTFGSCSAKGDYATCVASGTVNHPRSLWVHVSSRPHQKVSGSWTVICTQGDGAGSKSGNFSGTTTLTRRMKMNYKHPDQCTAAAGAQLSNGGNFIRVWLTAVR